MPDEPKAVDKYAEYWQAQKNSYLRGDKSLNPEAPKVKAVIESSNQQIAEATRKCPFCAEEIKLEAVLCKHCGLRLDVPTAALESKSPATIQKVENGVPKNGDWLPYIRIGVLIFFVMSLIGGYYYSLITFVGIVSVVPLLILAIHRKRRGKTTWSRYFWGSILGCVFAWQGLGHWLGEEPHLGAVSPVENKVSTQKAISISQLYRDYAKNPIKADQKYKDKSLTIQGKVGFINAGPSSINTYIDIGDDHPKQHVMCWFEDSDIDQLSKFETGQTVKVRGNMDVICPFVFYLRNCQIQAH